MTSYCFNVIVFIYITISLAAIITPIIRETFRGLGRMENVPQSRLSQCACTLLDCVYPCVVPRGASTMHQGGGVCIPAIREEGLVNICACANTP